MAATPLSVVTPSGMPISVVAMMLMSALRDTGASDGVVLEVALSLAARLATCALLLFVLMRWVLPVVLAAMARSQELLLFAIAWGVALAALGELAGFSKEAGAFLAGFSLASLPFREAINARLASLRDFLLRCGQRLTGAAPLVAAEST